MNPGLRRKLHRAKEELRNFTYNHITRPKLYSLSSAERIGVVFHEPSDMCPTDRIMLYALVRGLRPERAIEIGVRWGGSARIITNAMEDNGVGEVVGLDPDVADFRPGEAELHHRYKICVGYSPQDVPRAVGMLNGPLEFAFIDALHTHDAVYSDFKAVAAHLAPGAHVLFHDTYHQGIDAAIREVMVETPGFTDCGFITRSPHFRPPVLYQGLRLVRYGQLEVDSHSLIRDACRISGKPEPDFDPYYHNWDEWANGVGLGVKGPKPEPKTADEEVPQ